MGVGAANVRVSNVGHAWPFAWQAMTGLEHQLSERTWIGVGYKFLGTEDLHFRNTALNVSHANYYAHAVMLTLRWKFGMAPPPVHPVAAAAPPPPPPPPLPPPPMPQTYTVYFAMGSATLEPSARDVVRQAAQFALGGGIPRITVTGHTDTVGTSQYNQGLSERRAEAVRRELVAAGVPSNQIATDARGETDLSVPTANGVAEPRNRRVVITETAAGY